MISSWRYFAFNHSVYYAMYVNILAFLSAIQLYSPNNFPILFNQLVGLCNSST